MIEETGTGYFGYCQLLATNYRCIAPYDGTSWTGTLSVQNFRHLCGTMDNVFSLTGLSVEGSPYSLNLVVAQNANSCPVETF